jgi:DNA-binding response OmpR family regulator
VSVSRRERVLIIVPDKELRSSLSRILSSAGFIPLVTDSLRGGLAYLTHPFPRAVIFDEQIDGGVLPALFDMRARCENATMIAVLGSDDDRGLLTVGANGVVSRSRVLQEIVPALRAAMSAAPPPPPPHVPPPPPATSPFTVATIPPSEGSPVLEDHESLASTLREHLVELEEEDYFGVLEIPLDASTRDVRKAFLEHAKQWHPSRFGLDSAEVRRVVGDIFIVIKRAYDALLDPQKRAHFAQQAEELRPKRKSKKRAG